jgi:hypothetical protein
MLKSMLERRCTEEDEAGLVDLVSRRQHSSVPIKETPKEVIERSVSPVRERLVYSEEDFGQIINLIQEGKYAKSDVIKTLKEMYGISKKEALGMLSEYNKQKKEGLSIANHDVQVDIGEREAIDKRKTLIQLVNETLAETFGSEFKGNVFEQTYGFTRGPSYHLFEDVGVQYIAKVTNPDKGFLKLLNRLGLRMAERAVQTNDFLFVGRFISKDGTFNRSDGTSIEIFPQYEKEGIEFARKLQNKLKKKISVKIVEHLHGRDNLYCENNLSKKRENTY